MELGLGLMCLERLSELEWFGHAGEQCVCENLVKMCDNTEKEISTSSLNTQMPVKICNI